MLLITAVLAGATSAPLMAQEGADVTPTPVVGSASGQTAPQQTPQETQTQQTQPEQQAETQSQDQQTTAPANQQGQAPSPSGGVGEPVLAQGLIYLNGGDVVWQVREVEVAESIGVAGNARVILQQEGNSVIRNDLTGKRTRLEPGEAYFAAAGDPYSTFAEGDGQASLWIFEVSNSNAVGEGAFYLSPNVAGYGEAVYDLEFTRHVVSAGGTAQISAGDGPSMVMVLSGQIEMTDASGSATLAERDGLIVDGAATIEGVGGQAVVVSMIIGPQVSDASAAPPAAPATSDTDTPVPTPATSDEASESAPAESAEPAQPSTSGGDYVTSVQVGAQESIGVTMYVDGVVMFDGWLEPGEWTAFYDGSVFEVYTTSGENTLFQNSCGGDPFFMGYESGDAYYVLEASASSCAPVGG